MIESKNSALKKYPLWFELVFGIVCGILNSAFSTFFGNIGFPLFMDTIFSVTASFVGWWSGILSVIIFTLLSVLKTEPGLKFVSALFCLSVLAMCFIIRLVFRKKERITFLPLLLTYAFCVLFVSLIGGLVSTYAFNRFDYPDFYSIRYITFIFTKQHIPLIASSFLSRIPVNAMDKLISVFAGFGLYKLICLLWGKVFPYARTSLRATPSSGDTPQRPAFNSEDEI